ncbi:hypothetical protein IRY31_01305 [Corynebacterium afermentans subsp. lipophilum]|uniref:hypothetical protein n=1 Tax=Corynebacterium afermentans TaxID=38286 RepID=UPI00188B38F8|nr:hypothetical protein [Corynebacterium afermentans]MBF4546721.1 hypothetical protein [Corynebacterium afermentans subsp. lipophilum]WJY59082.1 hypothetical protein CAFEL_06610 [Corynebacterium afermentans subsp. lipophilum]
MRPNFWIVPGSPALALSPSDEASQRLVKAVRTLAGTADGRAIDIVCSLDDRWRTAHSGSFAAWGGPEITVRAGNHLGELVARFALGDPEVRQVRGVIGTPDPEAVTVVVLDGPAGLTQRAPLALVDGAQEYHQRLCGWLDGGQPKVVDKQLLEPALWHELAALRPREARLLDHDDTLGVGRYVAEWSV